ncbi:hypothetical protein HA464_03255 [Rhizobium leguminosarum bv. trifolii]|uniref:hypothetical protein n=1 Tax=Rhizobium ruizarguesonis TaxID=2081791 RepID=UPI00102F4176|nr:hypothetical protein [Rhizobium ruizarguesonis]QIO43095.1 hypothetical protein HA464_03255 [Rhizobium leguminosarum bv. trifolii]TAZ19505.1 hypothetical protein ELH77_12365 [Rhizobium ruizarguesonis]
MTLCSLADNEAEAPVDAEYWIHRYSMHGRVLAVPTTLYPGEHLRDALLRATHANGLENTGAVMSLANVRSSRRLQAFISLADAEEIGRVVDVLGIRPNAKQLAEVLKKAPGSSRGQVAFFGHSVERKYMTSNRRVSPRALQRSNYQRAIWSLRPLGFDPDTGETLLTVCPVCKIALGWSKTSGVNYCEKCPFRRVDLRDFPQPLIEPCDEKALRFFTDIINPEVSDDDFSKWNVPQIGSAPRGELFRLGIRIASGCQPANGSKTVTDIEPKYLELAGRAMLDWPDFFIELAEETAALLARSAVKINSGPILRLQYDQTISVDLRRKIRAIFNNRQSRSILINQVESSEPQDRVPDVGRQLLHPRAELLRLIRFRQIGVDVDNDLDVKIKVLRTIKEVTRTSACLGLPTLDVYELHRAGLLPHIGGVLADCGFTAPGTEDVKDLLQQLRDLDIRSSTIGGAGLASCRFLFDVRLSARWSRIFNAIFDREIEVLRGPSTGRGLVHDLHVTDVSKLERLLRSEQDQWSRQHVTVTQDEFAMMMGKSRSTASRFVEATGIASRLTLDALRAMRASWVIGFELRTLLELAGAPPVEVLRDLMRSNVLRVDARGVTLWAREQAMELCGL